MYERPGDEVKTTLDDGQTVIDPFAVITGTVGVALTVTDAVAAIEQPFAFVTV